MKEKIVKYMDGTHVNITEGDVSEEGQFYYVTKKIKINKNCVISIEDKK